MRPLRIVSCLTLLLTSFASSDGLTRDSFHSRNQIAPYGRLPLSFEANQGQSDPHVQFLTRGGSYTLFLTHSEAVLQLRGNTKEADGAVLRMNSWQRSITSSERILPNGIPMYRLTAKSCTREFIPE